MYRFFDTIWNVSNKPYTQNGFYNPKTLCHEISMKWRVPIYDAEHEVCHDEERKRNMCHKNPFKMAMEPIDHQKSIVVTSFDLHHIPGIGNTNIPILVNFEFGFDLTQTSRYCWSNYAGDSKTPAYR